MRKKWAVCIPAGRGGSRVREGAGRRVQILDLEGEVVNGVSQQGGEGKTKVKAEA